MHCHALRLLPLRKQTHAEAPAQGLFAAIGLAFVLLELLHDVFVAGLHTFYHHFLYLASFQLV